MKPRVIDVLRWLYPGKWRYAKYQKWENDNGSYVTATIKWYGNPLVVYNYWLHMPLHGPVKHTESFTPPNGWLSRGYYTEKLDHPNLF